MLLQARLPWNKLIHNGARNINSSYVDNECKKIFCTSMKRTNLILVQSHSQSLPCFLHYLFKFTPTKPTSFSRLCKNLSCVKFLLRPLWHSLNSLRVTSIYTQPIRSNLKQTNVILSSITFCRRVLFAMPTSQYRIKLCHSITNKNRSIFS